METIGKLAETSMVLPYHDTDGHPGDPSQHNEADIDLAHILQPHPKTTYIIRIKGDSMQEASIPDGCLAIVDSSLKPASGSIVAAMLDHEYTVKRLVKAGRHWVLHPENAFHKPVMITDDMSFQVLGVVTHVIVDLRR
jgi:DNA polymerase V